jgi:hypothetical protein
MKNVKIVVYIPIESKEKVKEAMFSAGAGTIGNYDHCSFEVIGTGQFRPLKGSNPALGQHGKIELVQEARVEMICPDHQLKTVIAAMKNAHPYEEVAFDVIDVRNIT